MTTLPTDHATSGWAIVPRTVKDASETTVLEKSETLQGAIIPELEDETALSFVSVSALGAALTQAGWSGGDEAKLLVEIAKDKGEGGRVRLMAMDAIRKRVLDALRFSGRLVKQTMKATEVSENKIDDVAQIVKSMQQTQFFVRKELPK